MKYRNANSVLPHELVKEIQKYVQGEYLYVPMQGRRAEKLVTDYKTELQKRNAHIYTKHLEGISNEKLAKKYNLAQSSIRRIILKCRKEYEEMNETIRQVLGHWDLQEVEIKQIYDTAWQVGDSYILKCYESLEMLERNLKITNKLDELEVPVGKNVPTLSGQQYVTEGEEFFFLSERLPGSNIVQMDDVAKTTRLVGETIATLHIAFKRVEDTGEFWNNSLLEEMNGWIKDNFIKSDWKYLSQEEYEKTVSLLSELYSGLSVQLIHRDVHFGNFLFNEGEFSGYIDFDLSQRNIRIFDVCYFLLGLLSEEEKLEVTEEEWFAALKNIFAGYESKLELSEMEKKAVPYVMECIELLFVSWFESADDTKCAEDAYKIFKFVKEREERILRSLN